MEPHLEDKLVRFSNDPLMTKAVFDVLLAAFVKPTRTDDVQTLAAQRIAIDLLHEAFTVINRYKTKPKQQNDTATNLAL